MSFSIIDKKNDMKYEKYPYFNDIKSIKNFYEILYNPYGDVIINTIKYLILPLNIDGKFYYHMKINIYRGKFTNMLNIIKNYINNNQDIIIRLIKNNTYNGIVIEYRSKHLYVHNKLMYKIYFILFDYYGIDYVLSVIYLPHIEETGQHRISYDKICYNIKNNNIMIYNKSYELLEILNVNDIVNTYNM